MNWTDRLWELRMEAIIELGRILSKGYDIRDQWRKSYQEDSDYRYEIPTCTYLQDGFYTIYSLVLYYEGLFLGYSGDEGEELWFTLDDLETQTICNLIDLINESD